MSASELVLNETRRGSTASARAADVKYALEALRPRHGSATLKRCTWLWLSGVIRLFAFTSFHRRHQRPVLAVRRKHPVVTGQVDARRVWAAAWNNSMGCLRDVCQQTIETIAREGKLAAAWSIEDATDMFVTVVSIANWEQLNKECH